MIIKSTITCFFIQIILISAKKGKQQHKLEVFPLSLPYDYIVVRIPKHSALDPKGTEILFSFQFRNQKTLLENEKGLYFNEIEKLINQKHVAHTFHHELYDLQVLQLYRYKQDNMHY